MKTLSLSLFALLGLFLASHPLSAQPWIPSSAPFAGWNALASSADGNTLYAVTDGIFFDPIGVYVSTDSGANWDLTDAPIDPITNRWSAVACSANGSNVVAACGQGLGAIYASTNSGLTWHLTSAPLAGYSSLASSADGTHLAAAAYSGLGIYTSTDSGAHWRTNFLGLFWNSVAMSSDGTKMVAAQGTDDGGKLAYSTNSGVTWLIGNAPTNAVWQSVACSSNGGLMVAVFNKYTNDTPGEVFTSVDLGAHWQPTTAPLLTWFCVACSVDGKFVSAGAGDDPFVSSPTGVYSSSDFGTTWTEDPGIPAADHLAYSFDGTKRVASYGDIYLYQPPIIGVRPRLNIARSGTNVLLYWATNQLGYHLQQKTNVTVTNWVAVTNIPVVSNGLDRVLVSPTNRQNFYRLVSP